MEDRKNEHIKLAFEASVNGNNIDNRFNYEPLLAAHPELKKSPFIFLDKQMHHPFWISSMTGGTSKAGVINKRLANTAYKFGLGMGMGSCRALFDSKKHLNDFLLRNYIGKDLPLYSNIGIAQAEKLLTEKNAGKIDSLNQMLHTDGTIIHVNPLQEAFQPEGDVFKRPPIETIAELVEKVDSPIIIKEVGQGMGYQSIKALLQLDIAAFEFGAWGGTNFTKLEQMRGSGAKPAMEGFYNIGHTAKEMTLMVNQIAESTNIKCRQIIISGGINSLLDAFYLHKICKLPNVIGMGSLFLNYALKDQNELDLFVQDMIKNWHLAEAFLTIKDSD